MLFFRLEIREEATENKMKIRMIIIGICLCSMIPFVGYNQINYCSGFDSIFKLLQIDSGSIWQIGAPNKQVFQGSYSDSFSIVTDLNSDYPTNDTSVFFVSLYDTSNNWVPNYLGIYFPIHLSFTHRFITGSGNDYGSIEMSLDGGHQWYDVLSDSLNAVTGYTAIGYYYTAYNYHYFESTGDTLFDSLKVSGNSNGWVHSEISKEVAYLNISHIDSIMFKFSFISDGQGQNEGWQIDDLCLSLDVVIGIEEYNLGNEIRIYPNPAKDILQIDFTPKNNQKAVLELYDVLGKQVLNKKLFIGKNQITISQLPIGVYTYRIGNIRGMVVLE
jgi:hypothetical protein